MLEHRWFIALLLLVAGIASSACTDLEADFVSRPDEPLYFACNSDSDCSGGYACVANAALTEDADAPIVGLCLESNAIGTVGDPAMGDCGPFLDARNDTRNASSQRCLLPFQCAADGIELPGDITECPLGFRCVEGPNNERCAACAFVSCDMSPYDADSATLGPVNGTPGDGCLVNGTSDASPYAGTAAGRIYCALSPSATYTTCPAGWTREEAPGACMAAGTDHCYIVAAVGAEWTGGDAVVTSNSGDEPVPELFLAVPGSTMSCRPLP